MENKLKKIGQNSLMDNFVKTDDILKDMCGIIETSQKTAYQAVNIALVQRNWMIGYRIAEEEFGGEERSEYGLEVIKKLSKDLTKRYGKGYDRSNLYHIPYDFIKVFLRLSTQCVDNLESSCRGHIIEHYYKFQIKQLEIGMRRKLPNRLGVFALCRGTFLLSIITVCFRHRKKSL